MQQPRSSCEPTHSRITSRRGAASPYAFIYTRHRAQRHASRRGAASPHAVPTAASRHRAAGIQHPTISARISEGLRRAPSGQAGCGRPQRYFAAAKCHGKAPGPSVRFRGAPLLADGGDQGHPRPVARSRAARSSGPHRRAARAHRDVADAVGYFAYSIAQRWTIIDDALRKHALAQPVIGLYQTGWPRLETDATKPWQIWALTGPGIVMHRICEDKRAAT